MSTFEDIVTMMTQRLSSAPAFGRQLGFVMDGRLMHIDGTTTPPSVSMPDVEQAADAVITVSVADFEQLVNKTMNPLMAFTTGKVKIKGDMMAATALEKVFV